MASQLQVLKGILGSLVNEAKHQSRAQFPPATAAQHSDPLPLSTRPAAAQAPSAHAAAQRSWRPQSQQQETYIAPLPTRFASQPQPQPPPQAQTQPQLPQPPQRAQQQQPRSYTYHPMPTSPQASQPPQPRQPTQPALPMRSLRSLHGALEPADVNEVAVNAPQRSHLPGSHLPSTYSTLERGQRASALDTGVQGTLRQHSGAPGGALEYRGLSPPSPHTKAPPTLLDTLASAKLAASVGGILNVRGAAGSAPQDGFTALAGEGGVQGDAYAGRTRHHPPYQATTLPRPAMDFV